MGGMNSSIPLVGLIRIPWSKAKGMNWLKAVYPPDRKKVENFWINLDHDAKKMKLNTGSAVGKTT